MTLSNNQVATIDEATANLITVAERLERVNGILLNISAPTALEQQALKDLAVARAHNRKARAILAVLRAGKSVP